MGHKSLKGAQAVTVVLASALAAGTAAPAAAAGRPTGPTGSVDGYGAVLSIADGRLREYQTTAMGCVPGYEAYGRPGHLPRRGRHLTHRPLAGTAARGRLHG
ncbi:hypothetical protein [Streptomyces sp. MB09-01]|uniref:hypothetical protein n=1 Tax=Streptomyces sp. MB09-01 TaxID=3028666 RepID=UPI0029CA80E7|nr:hypothetical protein [Streptomyces sp. MB09-01]